MAILIGYPGLEVTIEVDGQRAAEYDAPTDEIEARVAETNFYPIPQLPTQGSEPPYTIKYIESKPGKPFAFKFDSTNFIIPSPDGKKHEAAYECILDGTSTSYYEVPGGVRDVRNFYHSGRNKSSWKRYKFQFATLELVEGGNDSQVNRAKHYGNLLVKFYHIIKLTSSAPMMPPAGPAPTSMQSISEKAMKGRSVDNKVHFESEPLSAPPTATICNFTDPNRRPFAIFEFRYRTMEGLMSEGIVPRPASEDEQAAEPENERDQPLTSVKPDTEKALGIKPDPEQARGIKRELMDPEPLPVSYKLRRLKNGKVEIDLTDD